MRVLIVAVVVCMAGVALFFVPGPSDNVTRANYEKLSIGMSRADVAVVLGSDGVEASAALGVKAVTWYANSFGGANITAMFQDGRLVAKAQIGLR